MTSTTAAGVSSSPPSLTYLRPEVADLKQRLDCFVEEECIPAEEEHAAHLRERYGADRWTIQAVPPCVDRLKRRAQELGLWNLFIPPHLISKIPDPTLRPSIPGGLSYREYGILCESLGRSPYIAPEACNTSAPDTGNMEVLLEFGTPQQKRDFLLPLLRGEIRSTFLMTEPEVASSDPTNLQTKLLKRTKKARGGQHSSHGANDDDDDDDEYILTGRKWWSTGAMDPRCRMALVVARMEYDDDEGDGGDSDDEKQNDDDKERKHGAHTIVLVPMPQKGVILKRPLKLFGYDDAPSGHAEVVLDSIRLNSTHLISGEGSGFRVSQARLGPGRIHHCMRAIGMAARSLELMLQRAVERKTFGQYLWEHGGCQEMIADAVADLEAARLLTLNCAAAMDEHGGARFVREQVGMIKYAVPNLTYQVVDRAVQLFGGAGVSDDDHVLARFLCGLRSLRIADGPDAVHKRTVALRHLKAFHQKRMQSNL
ncbi:hypothetical protein ACA910_021942 [Epithemia clementina (nom. ined.)]